MIEIITLNDDCERDTFIFRLNYESYFDKFLFLELLRGIIKQKLSSMSPKQERDFFSVIFNLYSYTTACVMSHFKENDLYVIRNYTDDITLYIDVFRDTIKNTIDNDMNWLKESYDRLSESSQPDVADL